MNELITNRYYIITIIALFLSLSLGILIGGTLGQQWLNNSQHKLISYYEEKVEKLTLEKNELTKLNNELNANNEVIIKDYQKLFNSSIADTIEEAKILWINDSNYSYKNLQKSVELAGAEIEVLTNEKLAFNQEFNKNKILTSDYDVILFFKNDRNSEGDLKGVFDSKVPVVYVTDDKDGLKSDSNNNEVDFESLNEHYEFIIFLKNLLQEKSHE